MAVRLSSRGPTFFRQERTGQFGRPFRILKFRTMRPATHGVGPLVTAAGDSRITAVGRWLRKTKIDELPQLFNVLSGDMSIVGPRPEVPKYTALYNEEQRRTFLAKPGITGPAAIAFVNEEELLAAQTDREGYYVNTLLPAKLALDIQYCQNISVAADAKFILQTITRIVRRSEPENAACKKELQISIREPKQF